MDSSTQLLGQVNHQFKGCLVYLISSIICFATIPVYMANSGDPDQMPNSEASDLGLHCLTLPFCRTPSIKVLR